MEDLTRDLYNYFQNSPWLTYQIISSLVVVFVLWLLRFIAIRIINKKLDDPKLQYKWRKNLSYIAVFIGFLIIGRIWFEGLASLATFLGLLSAGLAIALKDPVTDLAAWLFIFWRKPFDVGDRIQIGENRGDVIDIRVFKFTILEIGNWVDADQSTGRVIHVPNHKVLTQPLANYTAGFEFIWNEIGVLITFESNWKKAKEILRETADKHFSVFASQAKEQVARAARSYLIYYRHFTPIVYTDVKDSGINLTVRFLINPRTRRGTTQAFWEDVLDAFNKTDDIDLAYPTIRVFNNPTKEKPRTH